MRWQVTFGQGANQHKLWLHRGFYYSWKEVWDGGSTMPVHTQLTNYSIVKDGLGKTLDQAIKDEALVCMRLSPPW